MSSKTQRERFEANYLIDLIKATGKDYTAEQMKDLRDGDGYGEGRHYLNGRWDGWQAAEAAEKWQPIETAPKDGTRFLAWHEGYVTLFHWQGDDGSNRPVGWRDNFIYVYVEGGTSGPTHWMPLPAAPVEREGDKS